MSADTEQLFLDEISRCNAEYWVDNDPKHDEAKRRMIEKYGSREKAIEETFLLLWRGFQLAVKMLGEDSKTV